MPYAILRTAKLKSFGEIGGSLSHNYRTRPTPNANPIHTPDNHHSVSKPDLVMDGIKQRLPDKTRSNAVLCVEYLITASPEWSGWQDQKQEADFFRRSLEWLEHKHGKENVIATSIHRDETTPHLVAYVVPIDSNGKLNARGFLGGRATLSKMQTDFHAKVKDLGLERGLEGSKAEHKTVKEFYAELQEPLPKPEKINVNIQRIDKENQPKSPFYDTKYEHGVRVMDAVYSDIESQVNEIKKDFEIKLKEMQADFERNLRVERQKSEAQRKAHEKAVDALQKNMKNINDLKNEFKDFIRYKHLFPDLFDDIAFKLKSEIEIYDHKQGLEEYQKKFFADQKRLERAREMPEPVK
ncbi:MobV family relaxase, partial [Acinetobacter baumannii]